MRWMRTLARKTKPHGDGYLRLLMGLSLALQGLARLAYMGIMHTSALPINILPAWLYGIIQIVVGVAIIVTGRWCWRLRMLGRGTAIAGVVVWGLLAGDAFLSQAYVSASTALLWMVFLANEVRVDEC